ncbi:DUF1800 domain-containing protein [Stieleria varia]|uniref:DUF1800 domain-containing protein n=1 Tax=Stieleria varia TaxID=2528005 RepID=A0A5C6AMS9_9BACT|nr:DUF1800 domain-containing protein [Stieleria varia]TWU01325.1 hypothetical protein Pla52n_46990 [Stieleria varia]
MNIDPDWAWSLFQPSPSQPWDHRTAAHLFRRAGFNANSQELNAAVGDGFAISLDRVMGAGVEPDDFRNQIDPLVRAGLASGSVPQLAAQWVYRMLATPATLLEKTTLFWHGHFATGADKVDDAELMQTQNDLLRQHALGDFSELLLEISRDPAMLIYLDSVSNRKSHPNENYAREIMELFCLGEGNYTESDIRELARCFTGWEIKRKRYRFNRYQHDSESKTILGQTGEFGGEDGVRIVVSQDAAPRFIVTKLIRFFVADELPIDDALIAPLAREMRDNGMQIGPTVRRILGSQLFYSSHAIARKVRSPVELAVGFLRALDGSTDNYRVATGIAELGQSLYYPPSVKGWDGGRTWINSSTLLGRSNLIREILDSGKTRFGKTTLSEYLDGHGVGTMARLVDFIEPLLFAVPISPNARERVLALQNAGSKGSAMADAIHLLCTLPEFQLA